MMNRLKVFLLLSVVASFSQVAASSGAMKTLIARISAIAAQSKGGAFSQFVSEGNVTAFGQAYPLSPRSHGSVPYVSIHGNFPAHAYDKGSYINIFRHNLPYVIIANKCFAPKGSTLKAGRIWRYYYNSQGIDNLELNVNSSSCATLTACVPHYADLDVHFDNCAIIYNHDQTMPVHLHTDSKELYNWIGHANAVKNAHKQHDQGWTFNWAKVDDKPDISLKTPQVIELRKAGDPQFADWEL